MYNFNYCNPVNVVFGQGEIAKLSSLVQSKTKVLLTYGGGSIEKNGVLEQVMQALTHADVILFGGIEANPDFDTLMKAVEICRNEQIGLILAVGGGSVIDGSKFIALATYYQGDAWDILTSRGSVADKAIPLGVIQTLPATGSEMNCFAVISRRSIGAKKDLSNALVYPKFAILDPLVTYSLPKRQLINGIVDPFIHVTEQYLTTDNGGVVQDGYAEAILRSLIALGDDLVNKDPEYNSRANWMWCATNALNGIIGLGADQDWATHQIGYELTAIYNLDHAQTLAIVAPRLWYNQRVNKQAKLLQFAKNVWNLNISNPEQAIVQAIIKTEEFFNSIGMKTKFADYMITVDIDKVIANLSQNGKIALGEKQAILATDIASILRNS